MDNFDVRKFITEAKLSEQKKAYVKYVDGSTEDRTFHQSVSDDKIKKMLAPGTFIDGKQVLKVLVGDALDQPMNEAEESYNQILQWAEENLNFELSDRIKDDIKDVLGDGVPVKVIKKMLSAPTGSRLNEEKDVLEPEESEEEDSSKEEKSKYYDILKKAESRLARNLNSSKDFLNNEYVKKEHILDSIRLVKNSDSIIKGIKNLENKYSEDTDENKIEELIYNEIVNLIIQTYFMKYEGIQHNSSIKQVRGILGIFSRIFEEISSEDFIENGSKFLNPTYIEFGKDIISNRKKYRNKSFDSKNLNIV